MAPSPEAVSDGLEDLPVDVHDGLVYIFELGRRKIGLACHLGSAVAQFFLCV